METVQWVSRGILFAAHVGNTKTLSSFLQTSAAQVLRNLVLKKNMDDDVREQLTAFLSNGQSYAPASGEIVGILTHVFLLGNLGK